MATHWTDFREYRRGRIPGDFSNLWAPFKVNGAIIEGASFELASRNRLILSMTSATRRGIKWSAPDQDTGLANQETLSLFRMTGPNNVDANFGMLRASGGIGTENGYVVSVSTALTGIQIRKFVSGTATALGAATPFGFYNHALYWQRFRVNGTTIQVKYWNYNASEPVSWTVTQTDSAVAGPGSVGLMWNKIESPVEVFFFSVGTNGDTAPGLEVVSESMESWIKEPDEELDTIVRMEYYNPDTNAVESEWISRLKGRITGFSDYPSEASIKPLLESPGIFSFRLESDAHLGGMAVPQLGTMEFNNKPNDVNGIGPLDSWISYSFYGRSVEIRMGKIWQTRPSAGVDGVLNPIRQYEIVASGIPSQEPTVSTDKVTVPLSTSLVSINSRRIPVKRNVGISTGIKALSTSGSINIPTNSIYSRTSFTVMLRLFLPLAGIAGSGSVDLTRRGTTVGQRQWRLLWYNAGTTGFENKLQLLVDDSGGGSLINSLSDSLNDDNWHEIIFGVNGGVEWYWLIDTVKIDSGSLIADPVTPASAIGLVNGSTGVVVCDHRLELFHNEENAISRFSAIRQPDSLNLSMHRCNDGVGTVVTDYNTTANHGALIGTGSDISWVPTYLGSSELSGNPMPMSGGVLFHAPTAPIDSVRDIFRYNDRSPTPGAAVQIRAKGLVLTGGGVSYTEPTDGPGTVDIVTTADQPITYGLVASSSPENPNIHVPRLIKNELIDRGALTVQDLDTRSLDALRVLLPMKGGFHYSEPPNVGDFIGNTLKSIGCYYSIDDGRVSAGCMLPPVNPGPYGFNSHVEFLGYPDCGVIAGVSSNFSLTQHVGFWSIAAVVKFHGGLKVDSSISNSFTYFPSGMTIIDNVGASSTGYYLGVDGRNKSIIFGAPGITSNVTGKHYLEFPYIFENDRWYAVQCAQDSFNNMRTISIFPYPKAGETINLINESISESTAGSLTTSVEPLLIGHGLRGDFYGSLAYVSGASPNRIGYDEDIPPEPITGGLGVGTDRWFFTLTDGIGDVVLDAVSGNYSPIIGVRWCPKMIFDFRAAAEPQIISVRRPIPAWRVESKYSENWQPLIGTNVVAGVSASDRISLSFPSLSNTDRSEEILNNYLDSRDVLLASPYVDLNDTVAVLRMLRDRISPEARFKDVSGWWRDAFVFSLGDEILTYDSRFFPGGRAARIVFPEMNLNDHKENIGLWG